MKAIHLLPAALTAMTMFSTSAFGYFVGTTDVGSEDTQKAYVVDGDSSVDTCDSPDYSFPLTGAGTEADWVNCVLSTEFDSNEFKVEDAGPTFSITEDGGYIAFEMPATPQYYLVKHSDDYVLFENNAEFDWAVISISFLEDIGFHESGAFSDLEFSTITYSHLSGFGSAVVSEPATLGLLSLGALGLIGARRRSKS